MFESLIAILIYAETWLIYTKMGMEGWIALAPFYSSYSLFKKLYGDGWRFLFLLVPFYNIYVWFKLYIDLAHEFNKSTAFGVGMAFFYPLFAGFLAFGNEKYGDGSEAIQGDILQRGVDSLIGKINEPTPKKETSSEILDAIAKIDKLHEDGIISDEDYQTKKDEFISRL